MYRYSLTVQIIKCNVKRKRKGLSTIKYEGPKNVKTPEAAKIWKAARVARLIKRGHEVKSARLSRRRIVPKLPQAFCSPGGSAVGNGNYRSHR